MDLEEEKRNGVKDGIRLKSKMKLTGSGKS